MKFLNTIVKAALPVLAIAIATPAFAQAGASASAGSLGYELIDLDTSDGITPWLAFQDIASVSTYATIFRGSSENADPLARVIAFGPSTSLVDEAGAAAYAQASWTELASSATAHANMATSTAVMHQGFVLSPNTEVRFFALGTVDTDAEEWASTMAVTGLVVTLDSGESIEDDAYARNGEAYTGWMNASVASHGAAAVQGRVGFATYTESYALAMPVPEPAAPAMLFGGLGLLAAMRLRRHIR